MFLKKIQINIQSNSAECALLCDGMKIKSNVIYNKHAGSYEGFIDFGKDTVAPEEDVVATEAIVFMLVWLRNHWKYPIGYVLCNSIDAVNLHCLLSKPLGLSGQHNLDVHSIILDDASSNIAAIRLFKYKFGKDLSSIDGKFTLNGFNHELYFTPDPCHMVQLARNALADSGNIVGVDGEHIEWRHIVKLHELKLDKGFKFGNKLSSRHSTMVNPTPNLLLEMETLEFGRNLIS